jgi:hypothetical protein
MPLLEAGGRRVTNYIPFGCPLFLPVHTVNCVQTLKVLGGQAFDKCTACSPTVLAELQADPAELMVKCCNNPTFLEDLTVRCSGLKRTLHSRMLLDPIPAGLKPARM